MKLRLEIGSDWLRFNCGAAWPVTPAVEIQNGLELIVGGGEPRTELSPKGPNSAISRVNGMRASFKFTLRNTKFSLCRDFTQMQTDSCVFAENNIIWQPYGKLILFSANLRNKPSKPRPMVRYLGGFNTRLLAEYSFSWDFPKFCLASSEQLDYFVSAAARHGFIEPKSTPVIKGGVRAFLQQVECVPKKHGFA